VNRELYNRARRAILPALLSRQLIITNGRAQRRVDFYSAVLYRTKPFTSFATKRIYSTRRNLSPHILFFC
jgi:hypothetical protein